jgi:cytochrome oxidase assembly protein ShyY1
MRLQLKQSVKPWIRWTGWFLVASVFAIACVALASWQIERRSEAVSKIERVAANYDLNTVALDEVSSLDPDSIVSYEWRSVELSGRYLTDDALLVRNRAIAGQPGFVQLVPFETTNGEVVVIERGWIPADSELNPSRAFLPSEADKIIIARVRLGEVIPNRDSPTGQLTSINLPEISELLAQELETSFYLRMLTESPAENENPQPLSRPVLDEGNHLSYAVQWIIFAAMGFFALFWAIRQEQEYRRMENDPSYVPRAARRKANTDSSVEDEILDRTN